MEFECPQCQSKTVFDTDSGLEDITTTSTFVCPSCQTLYDIDLDANATPTKSKFDKTNYWTKVIIP